MALCKDMGRLPAGSGDGHLPSLVPASGSTIFFVCTIDNRDLPYRVAGPSSHPSRCLTGYRRINRESAHENRLDRKLLRCC